MPVVAAAAFLILFILNWRGSVRSERLVTRIRTGYVPALELAIGLSQSLAVIQRSLQNAVAASDVANVLEADAAKEDMIRQIEAGRENSILDESALKELELHIQAFYSVARPAALSMIGREAGTDLTAPLGRMTRGYPALKVRLDQLLSRQKREMETAFESTQAAQRTSAGFSSAVILLGLVVLVGLSIVIGRSQELTAEALRESEKRYRQLFEGNPEPMWVYDGRTLKFLEANEAAVMRYGFSREELLAMTLRDIRTDIAVSAIREETAGPPELRLAAEVWKHRTRDGRVLDVEVTEHEISFYGRPARLALLTDVTEKRKAEELLWKSQKMLKDAQRTAHIGSWDWDLATKEIVWSEELFHITGQDSRVFRPTLGAFLGVVHPDDRTLLETRIEEWMRTGNPSESILRVVRPNGDVRTLLSSGSVVLDPSGNVVRVFGTCQDVTEQTRLEDQLRQSQKMEAVGRLAGGVAHDFNNLLTVIQGYADVLSVSSGVDGYAERTEAIEQIRIAGQRAAALTRQLLAFSRQSILQTKVLELNPVVSNIAPMLRRVIGEDITLVTNLDPKEETVLADAGQLEQVIMNLAVNSRDAMPQGGTLTVETSSVDVTEIPGVPPETPRGRYARLTVTDTGTGMSQQIQARVFEPFFTTKEVGKGTGLGLATVYGIVKQSGGFIRLNSEPGQGATFHVYLPCARGEVARTKPVSGIGPAPPGERIILLIEDEAPVRKLIRSVLTGHGYTVLEAGTGEEALAVSSGHPGTIHLILSDVVMPGTGGPETVEELLRSRPTSQVIFMSGYTDDSVVRHGLTDGDKHFIQKPFTAVALLKQVREVLTA